MEEGVYDWRGSVKPHGLRSDAQHMKLTAAKRRALRSGVRELLVKVGAAMGLVVGLLVAIGRPPPAPAAGCKQSAEQSIGACFNETVLSTALPYAAAVGLGIVIGALIGLLPSCYSTEIGQVVGHRLRHLRRRQRRATDAGSPPATPASAATAAPQSPSAIACCIAHGTHVAPRAADARSLPAKAAILVSALRKKDSSPYGARYAQTAEAPQQVKPHGPAS